MLGAQGAGGMRGLGRGMTGWGLAGDPRGVSETGRRPQRMIEDWGQAGDPKGWQRTLGDRQETPEQTRGAGDRQVML